MLGFVPHHQPTVLCLFLWSVEFDESLLHSYFGRLVVTKEPQHDDHCLFEYLRNISYATLPTYAGGPLFSSSLAFL